MNYLPTMSNYARRMTRLKYRIFGEVARPTDSKSMKVVRILSERPKDIDPYIVDYYPPHVEYSNLIKILREHGLFRYLTVISLSPSLFSPHWILMFLRFNRTCLSVRRNTFLNFPPPFPTT